MVTLCRETLSVYWAENKDKLMVQHCMDPSLEFPDNHTIKQLHMYRL